jgi:hypothetical protein
LLLWQALPQWTVSEQAVLQHYQVVVDRRVCCRAAHVSRTSGLAQQQLTVLACGGHVTEVTHARLESLLLLLLLLCWIDQQQLASCKQLACGEVEHAECRF